MRYGRSPVAALPRMQDMAAGEALAARCTVTAATLTRTPLKKRLETLLDYMVQGAYPPDSCTRCAKATADRCDACAGLLEDFASLNAALGKVQEAASEREALGVYLRTCMHLTGIFPGSAAVLAPTEAGGVR